MGSSARGNRYLMCTVTHLYVQVTMIMMVKRINVASVVDYCNNPLDPRRTKSVLGELPSENSRILTKT